MLLNYIKIAFKTFGRHKLFTFISLFGICFTLYALITLVSLFENTWGPGSPEINQNRTLRVADAEVTDTEGNLCANGELLSTWFFYTHVKPLKSAEKVSIYSTRFRRFFFKNDEKIELNIKYTDAEFWEIHDFTLIDGDYYSPSDVELQVFSSVISSHAAMKLFGDQNAIGKFIDLDGKKYRVGAVVKDVSSLRRNTYSQIWIPVTTMDSNIMDRRLLNNFSSNISFSASILAEKRSDFKQIRDELETGISGMVIPQRENSTMKYASIKVIPVTPVEGIGFSIFHLDKGNGIMFYTAAIFGILLFMLLPAINLININLSRIMERSVEIGVRKVFGASRPVLIGQFMIENILLTFIGGGISFILTLITLKIVNTSGIIANTELFINIKIFLYGMVLTLLFGFISGVFPAVRMSGLEPADCLKGGEV